MAKLQNDLREFIELLNSHNVEYVIVGGHAVAFHGHPRFTGHIDFFIRMSPPNAERLLAVLSEFGFGALDIDERDLLEPKRVLRLGYPPNQIDILTSIQEWISTRRGLRDVVCARQRQEQRFGFTRLFGWLGWVFLIVTEDRSGVNQADPSLQAAT